MKRKGARLGQHFLTGAWAARALARAAGIRRSDAVLEIGPGEGALTRELLTISDHVVAIEKDSTLVNRLRSIFSAEIARGALTLIEGDVRDIEPEKLHLEQGNYIVAANIPYYLTGEIIRMFLSSETQPHTMALLVQKEVADRIVARDGKESILSLSIKAYGAPKIVAKVSRGNFSPPPSVDSAIITIGNISRDFFTGFNEEHFFRILKTGFSSKRKLLSGNLKRLAPTAAIAAAMHACELPERVRAEDIPLEKWKCLVMHVPEITSRVKA